MRLGFMPAHPSFYIKKNALINMAYIKQTIK